MGDSHTNWQLLPLLSMMSTVKRGWMCHSKSLEHSPACFRLSCCTEMRGSKMVDTQLPPRRKKVQSTFWVPSSGSRQKRMAPEQPRTNFCSEKSKERRKYRGCFWGKSGFLNNHQVIKQFLWFRNPTKVLSIAESPAHSWAFTRAPNPTHN